MVATCGKSCNRRARLLSAHFRDSERLVIEDVEERPVAYHQSEAADADRPPEGAVGCDAADAFGDLLETQARFLLHVLRRRFQNSPIHDDSMGQGVLHERPTASKGR